MVCSLTTWPPLVPLLSLSSSSSSSHYHNNQSQYPHNVSSTALAFRFRRACVEPLLTPLPHRALLTDSRIIALSHGAEGGGDSEEGFSSSAALSQCSKGGESEEGVSSSAALSQGCLFASGLPCFLFEAARVHPLCNVLDARPPCRGGGDVEGSSRGGFTTAHSAQRPYCFVHPVFGGGVRLLRAL